MFKKLTLILLAVLFVAGIAYAEAGSRTSPGRGEIVQMPFQSDPPKRFRLVRYLGTTDTDGIAADSIVVWDTTIDDGVTINTTTTSWDSSVAGILVTAILTQDTSDNTAVEDIGRDNWAWLQTYGISQVNLAATSNPGTAGAAMGTSTTAGEASVLFASTTSAAAQGYAGFLFDASTAGDDDIQVFVRTE